MPRDLRKETYRILADAYQQLGSLRAVAEEFGVSASPVKAACAMFSVPMHSRGARRCDDEARLAAIRDAIVSGMSKRAARKYFKASDTVIQRALGEPERQRKVVRISETRKKGLDVDQALRDELEMAMKRDRERLAEADKRRTLRMVA